MRINTISIDLCGTDCLQRISRGSKTHNTSVSISKLFKSITLLGFIFLILSSKTGSGYLIGSFTLLSGIICHAMIGATNEAKDKGNDRLFKILHSVSVLLTISVFC